MVDSNNVLERTTGYECPECHRIFLIIEAPEGRLPSHIPVYDPDRVLDCRLSGTKGIELTTTAPIARKLTIKDIASAIY